MVERLAAAAGLFVAANFCMSYIIPAPAGAFGWLIFPFGGVDAPKTWTFGEIDGFPLVLMLGLAGIAVLAFAGAFLATFGWWVQPDLWRPLVLVGAVCSGLLFVLHLGPWAVIPLGLNIILFWVAWASVWAPPTSG
jgi:hypothetical protein